MEIPKQNLDMYVNVPQPIRYDGTGGYDTGPRDIMRDLENPDMLVPPETDAGLLPNMRFSFSDTSMTLNRGEWSREVTVRELPIATTLAGVNMSLTPGGVRELHWHQQAEWAYMILGRARITSIDAEGRNFIADVGPGDLWYFPLDSHIPFRGWNTANSCSSSMTVPFLILTLYPSPIGLHTPQKMCCLPISEYQLVPLITFL